MGFLERNPSCNPYFPIEKEMVKLPKQWIINVIYSKIGENFADWVKERIVARNAAIVEKQKLAINMDPAVALAFQNSNAISSKYNDSHFYWSYSYLLFSFHCSIFWHWSKPVESGVEKKKDQAGNRGPATSWIAREVKHSGKIGTNGVHY